ncbi:MAG: N-acetylglucosamine-6-phosphate deacetylase [Acidimicrobiales bacterium]
MTLRIDAARVLRPDGSLTPGTVVIDGERIAAVEELAGPAPDRTIAPGLIDIQVNGFAGIDVAEGSAADLAHLGDLLAMRGTTSWCPTLTSRELDWYAGWFAAHPEPAPGEVGIHLEGPFINRPGAHRRSALRPPDTTWLTALPDRVRYVTLAPDLPGAIDAIELLVRRGIVVALGHSEAGFADATDAAAAGATLVTHVFNAMAGLGHRNPGLVGAALSDGRLTPAIIGDGVHVHAAILAIVLGCGPAILVSDAVAWEREGLQVSGGAARLSNATLAGSVITVLDAVHTAVAAGVDLATALTAATATPARVLGVPGGGELRPHAVADVVLLDPDLRLTGVWRKGQPVLAR